MVKVVAPGEKVETDPGGRRSGADPAAYHPAPLRDAPVALEPELLEQVLGPGVEVGAPLRRPPLDLLGVGLDQPAPGRLDGAEHRGHRGPGHPSTAVAAAG